MHPRILAMIEQRPQPCKDGFFHYFIDGDILKSHPLFLRVHTALHLILYTDEMNCAILLDLGQTKTNCY